MHTQVVFFNLVISVQITVFSTIYTNHSFLWRKLLYVIFLQNLPKTDLYQINLQKSASEQSYESYIV